MMIAQNGVTWFSAKYNEATTRLYVELGISTFDHLYILITHIKSNSLFSMAAKAGLKHAVTPHHPQA